MAYKYDPELIKDYFDIEYIIDYFGIEKRKHKYKKIEVECPFQSNDENFGNCYIDLDKQTLTCYSCNISSADVISITQKMENLNFPAALEFLANLSGNPDAFKYDTEESKIMKETKKLKDAALNSDELEFLHIVTKPVYGVVNLSMTEIKDKHCEKTRGSAYYVEDKLSANVLFDLYKEDFSAYKFIMHSKADNILKIYIDMKKYVLSIQTKDNFFNTQLMINAVNELIEKAKFLEKKYA